MSECPIESLPATVLLEIFRLFSSAKQLAVASRVNRRWRSLASSPSFWFSLRLEGECRLSLRQLTSFCTHSPHATHVRSLRIEGFVVRRPENGTQTTVTNHLLGLMSKNMPNLSSLCLFNANIVNISMRMIPKSLVRLSLTGSIVEYNALSDLTHSNLLPHLRHLELDYVHNLTSYSKSVTAILHLKKLQSLDLRHCYKVSNADLRKIPSSLTSLSSLNLCEIAALDDEVLQSLALLTNLSQLFIAFTAVTDVGVVTLGGASQRHLRLVDLRGCPRVTASSLLALSRSNVREVWISRLMKGAQAVRDEMMSGSPLRILDEVDRREVSLAQHIDRNSAHFQNVFGGPQAPNIVVANMIGQ